MTDFLILGVKCGLLGVAAVTTFTVCAVILLPLVNGTIKLMSMIFPGNGGRHND